MIETENSLITGKTAVGQIPVVCFGLSSGGFEPLEHIFRRLKADTGWAFVVIPHLSRTEPSWLPWLFSKWSQMPVEIVRGGLVLKPNHIYVIPPGEEIILRDGHFGARPRSKVRGWSNVITLFLDSLAKPRKSPGIAVILSGLDSDGAAALQAFHNLGGTTIVQEPGTASFPQMPESAIDTGFVDYVLPPEEIAKKIEEIAQHRRIDNVSVSD